MNAQEHNRLLSIFFYIQAGLQAFGVIIGLIYAGIGAAMLVDAPNAEAEAVAGIMLAVGVFVIFFAILFSVMFFIAGRKLGKAEKSGRTLGIIASIFCLPGIPLGTALGIYGLWFLLGSKGTDFYLNQGQERYSIPPPPPHNWR
ncbi:MAG: hypothetical protein R2684_07210 [Pyrinomonadaceae bacterium]